MRLRYDTAMGAATKPLHADFGVEVDCIPAAPELAALLAQASLVVIRDAVRDDAALLALGARLGTIDGSVKRFEARGPVGDQRWHHVGGIRGAPARATLLYPETTPVGVPGLAFVSMRAAWQALPVAQRTALAALTALHVFRTAPDTTIAQPLVLADPDTGRESLFVGYHASGIAGMDPAAGAALLGALMEAATVPQRVYAHCFEPGDLVAWDNRALMHRACAVPAGAVRAVREVALR